MKGNSVEMCGACRKHNPNIEVATDSGNLRQGVCLPLGLQRDADWPPVSGCPEGHDTRMGTQNTAERST